jgi:adenosylcobinamide-GDP ribazoletransferase
VSGLSAAVRYLTIVPFPGREHGSLERLGRAAAWFPVVGLGIGAGLVVVEHVATRLFPQVLAALLVVTAWKLVSGGLHLDGLADCVDGLVGRDPAHRLAIMRDSRIGAFGALGLILFLLLEIAALTELPASMRWRALLVTPAVARAMPVLVARLYGPARRDGHGAAFHAGLGRTAAPLALGIALVVSVLVLGVAGIVVVGAAAVVAVALGRFMSARLGGITGDVFGAVIEASELGVLLTVSAWVHTGLA